MNEQEILNKMANMMLENDIKREFPPMIVRGLEIKEEDFVPGKIVRLPKCDAYKAGKIGQKLYTKTANQLHLAAWCKNNLDTLEGSLIYSEVKGLRMSMGEEAYMSVVKECRQRLTELGYVPLESSKSN